MDQTMTRNMESAIAMILQDEGGVADVGDGKGTTRYGQTPDWLEAWDLVPPSNVSDAAVNYETVFVRTGIAEVIERDVATGHALATFAVHAGEVAAIKALQRELQVTVDGAIGPETLAALDRASDSVVAHSVVAAYGEHLGAALANTKRDNRKFARGWMLRLGRLIRGLA
jgi:lysozyme family protein